MSRFLDSVPVAAIGYFRASAEKLIEERGAVDALAAALAHISGATSLEQRSLLNSDAVSYLCMRTELSLLCHTRHRSPSHTAFLDDRFVSALCFKARGRSHAGLTCCPCPPTKYSACPPSS